MTTGKRSAVKSRMLRLGRGRRKRVAYVTPRRRSTPLGGRPTEKVPLGSLAGGPSHWIPVFELLEQRGFQVLLVDARKVKNVSGRKSDVLDCQWLFLSM